MTTQQQQFRKLVGYERWCALRFWCFAIGLVALVFALVTLGLGGVGNPKSASSVWSAFAAGGLLRWLAMPLIYIGVGALAASAAISAFLWRGRGDT